MRSLFAATLALAAASGSAFLLPNPTNPAATVCMSAHHGMDRRDALSRSAAGAALAILGVAGLARPVRAAEEVPLVRDRMGGLLEPYTDIAKVRLRVMVWVMMWCGVCGVIVGLFDRERERATP